jgi:iron complex outermembrane receptor protein
LRQDITPDINVYASVNRGFKAGSYSLQSPLNKPYLPQTITAYEAGIKSELFDRKLRLNLSAYHYDIQDYQVRSAATAALGASVTLNAATVKVDGIDLDFEAAPTEHLRIFGGATILDSRYGKFGGAGATFQAPIVYPNFVNPPNPTDVGAGSPTGTRGVCPIALRGTKNPGVLGTGALAGGYTTCFGDVSGLRTMNAPKFTASFGASYKVPVGETGEVRLSALYSYNSGYVFEPDNIAKQPSYSLVNASIEYRPVEQLGIELWGRNLGNEKYAVQKITSGTGVTQSVGAPRTYGVNLNFSF